MTAHTEKQETPSATPDATDAKAVAVEESSLDHYPHDHDNDVNEDHPDAEIAPVVNADDRASQTVKANVSSH